MKQKLLLIMAVMLMVFVTACGGGEGDAVADTAYTIDKVKDKGKLVVGTAPGYFPFEMKDMDGNFVGYDMDVAEAIAEELEVELEYKQFQFDGLIPALQTDEIDMILAGMTSTGSRALTVSFSDPYHETGQVIMVPKSDTETKTWEDLDKPDKKIALSIGTTGAILAKEVFENAELMDFEDFPAASMAMVQGEADAVVYDEPAVRVYEAMNPDDVRGIYDLISSERLAIAVKKNDFGTVQWLNAFLASYKDSPAELASREKWFEDIESWIDEVQED